MGRHPALVAHQPTGSSSPEQSAALVGGVRVGHVHGGRSYLRLPPQKTSLSYLLTELQDISYSSTTLHLQSPHSVQTSSPLSLTLPS